MQETTNIWLSIDKAIIHLILAISSQIVHGRTCVVEVVRGGLGDSTSHGKWQSDGLFVPFLPLSVRSRLLATQNQVALVAIAKKPQ